MSDTHINGNGHGQVPYPPAVPAFPAESAAAPVPPAVAAPVPPSVEPPAPSEGDALQNELFRQGFLTSEQLADVVHERVRSGRTVEEVVRESGLVPPAVLDRLLGRLPEPVAVAAPASPAPVVPEPAPLPALPEPSVPATPAPDPEPERPADAAGVRYEVVIRLDGGGVLIAGTHAGRDGAREHAARLVESAEGGSGWLDAGDGFVRSSFAVAVQVRPRID